MRYNIGKLSIIATASALIMTGMGAVGVAQAQPVQSTSLYAPSALVLSVGKSNGAAVTVQRAVTLSCAPRPSGTHPSPTAACADLLAVDGEFTQLTTPPQRSCTREWDPVVINANGVWQGQSVSWSATFSNACAMQASLTEGSVFGF